MSETYPMHPHENSESAEAVELVTRLALDNPMPPDLREQVANWIEPETLNCGIKHRDVMSCIDIAYPLIREYIDEHWDAA